MNIITQYYIHLIDSIKSLYNMRFNNHFSKTIIVKNKKDIWGSKKISFKIYHAVKFIKAQIMK